MSYNKGKINNKNNNDDNYKMSQNNRRLSAGVVHYNMEAYGENAY